MHRMSQTEAHTLPKTLGTFQLWGIAVGLVISGEYFGWSYGWDKAGTLGFLVTSAFVALMYTTFIFSFTELTTAVPHAGVRSSTAGAPSGRPAATSPASRPWWSSCSRRRRSPWRSAPTSTCSTRRSSRSGWRSAPTSSSWR
jgi:hypothetical protein